MSGATSNASSKGGCGRPSPLACTECRKRHLKCDATQPICSRCSSAGLECVYMPSRRGYRGPSKRKADYQHDEARRPAQSFERRASDMSNPTSDWSLFPPTESVTTGFNDHFPFPGAPAPTGKDVICPLTMFSGDSTAQPHQSPPIVYLEGSPEDRQDEEEEDDTQLINLYYANFHAAHPILVPRAWYSEQSYPKYLRLVVQFIGSHFSVAVSSDSLRATTSKNLETTSIKSPFMVQALLLFSIALHSRNEAKEAEKLLARAVNMALEMGMNRRDFATVNGRRQAVVEESLRRTWWEVFIVDGYLAALHRKSSFKTGQVDLKTPLPCEETVFAEGICLPTPPTLAQFDMRLFADEEIQFSSFCYRIESVRILSRVLAIAGTDEVHEDQIQAVDNALAGWVHHLPATKVDIVNDFGEVDSMIFQAHMIIQCATIFLHFPRSNLLSTLPGTAEIVCARGGKQLYPATTQHMHAIKATDGSKELSNLAALRLPVQKHTPFFICALVLSAIVQLSACTVHACHCVEQHRDRVALIIGILKSLSQHWTIASHVLQQIKRVGSEVLQVCNKPDDTVEPESSRDSGVDVTTNMDDFPWFDLFGSQGLAGFPAFDAAASYGQPP